VSVKKDLGAQQRIAGGCRKTLKFDDRVEMAADFWGKREKTGKKRGCVCGGGIGKMRKMKMGRTVNAYW
jgi:hypothetical protein